MASQSKKASTGVRSRNGGKKTAAAARTKSTLNAKRKTPDARQDPGDADGGASAAQRLGDAIALQSLLAKSFARSQPGGGAEPEIEDRPLEPLPEGTEPAAADDADATKAAGGNRLGGRLVKSLAGLLLLALAVWVPASQLLQVASAEAVVNARLVTLRAPIGGALASDGNPPTVGSEFAAGATLLTIANPRVDRGRLEDAIRAVEQSLDERTRIETDLAALRDQQAMLETQLEDFRAARIELIEARLANGTAAGPDAFDAADELRIELDALRNGIFIGDSYNDRPNSAQRLDVVATEVARLEGELTVNRARHPRLIAARQREQAFVDQKAHATVLAPVRGRVWEMLTSPGEHVVEGQELVRLMDCSLAIVTAVVSEAVYNRLVPGMSASFTFREGGEPLAGTVVQLTGVSAAPANYAILPSALRAEHFRVAVAVPGLGDGSAGCAVGRTGRVVFDTSRVAS